MSLSLPNEKLSSTTLPEYLDIKVQSKEDLKLQYSYFLISYLSTFPFFTWLKSHAMTNGPLEVTMVVSCEFGPVLNLEYVSEIDHAVNDRVSPSGREVNT